MICPLDASDKNLSRYVRKCDAKLYMLQVVLSEAFPSSRRHPPAARSRKLKAYLNNNAAAPAAPAAATAEHGKPSFRSSAELASHTIRWAAGHAVVWRSNASSAAATAAAARAAVPATTVSTVPAACAHALECRDQRAEPSDALPSPAAACARCAADVGRPTQERDQETDEDRLSDLSQAAYKGECDAILLWCVVVVSLHEMRGRRVCGHKRGPKNKRHLVRTRPRPTNLY